MVARGLFTKAKPDSIPPLLETLLTPQGPWDRVQALRSGIKDGIVRLAYLFIPVFPLPSLFQTFLSMRTPLPLNALLSIPLVILMNSLGSPLDHQLSPLDPPGCHCLKIGLSTPTGLSPVKQGLRLSLSVLSPRHCSSQSIAQKEPQ